MSNNKDSGSGAEILSPILVILVAGSISLAIVNKANHTAYFDIVKIAIAYSFGSMKYQNKIQKSEKQDQADEDKLK